MEFREAIKRRRMIRSYSDLPVERTALERIVEAARLTPSAGFAQGLRLVIVTAPRVRRAIAELAGESQWRAKGFEPWIGRAPVILVLAVSEADYHARYQEPDKLGPDGEIDWPVPYWYVDGGAALMAVLLAAVDEGLAAGFLGVHAVSELRDLVGLGADDAVIGLITLGHHGPQASEVVGSARRPRRPVDSQVTWLA